MYFIKCEYCISSFEIDYNLIIEELQIEPTRFKKKGEKFKTISGEHIRPLSLWALASSGTVSKNLDCLSKNLKELENVLKQKMNILRRYKMDSRLFCSLLIEILSNNKSCFGFGLSSSSLNFFGGITNEIHFSIYSNEDFRERVKSIHSGRFYRKVFERYDIMSSKNFFVESKSFSKEELINIKNEMKNRCCK